MIVAKIRFLVTAQTGSQNTVPSEVRFAKNLPKKVSGKIDLQVLPRALPAPQLVAHSSELIAEKGRAKKVVLISDPTTQPTQKTQ